MTIDRLLKSLFSATSLVVILFLTSCVLFLHGRGLERDLQSCQFWSTEAYLRLSPSAKRDLNEQFQLHVDMLEDMADRDSARDPNY